MVRYPIMTAGANVVNPGLPIKYCLLFAVLVAAAGLGSLFLSEKHKKEQLLEDVMVLDTLLKKSLEKSLVHKLKFAAKNAELEQEQLHLEKLYRELKEMEAKNKELMLMLEDALLIKKRRGKSSNDEVAREGRADETKVDETETKFRVIEPEKPSKTKEKPEPSLFDFFNAIVEGAFRKTHAQAGDNEDDQVDVYFDVLGDDKGNVLVVSKQEENPDLQLDIVKLEHSLSSLPEENQANVVSSESKEEANTNGIVELNRIEEALEIVGAVKMGVNHHPLVMEVEFQDDIKLEQIPNSIMEEFERDAKSESISPPGTLDEPKGNFIEIQYNPLILENEFGKDNEIVSKSNELESSDNVKSSSIEKEKERDSKTKANTEEATSESGKERNEKPMRNKSKSSNTETKQKSLQNPDENNILDIITGPKEAENDKNTEMKSVISDGKDNTLESKASNINTDEIHKDTKTKAKSVSERKQPRKIEPNPKTDISKINKNKRKESKPITKIKESGGKQQLESNGEDDIDTSNKNLKPESKSVSKRKGPKKEASVKGNAETDITKLNKRAESGNQPKLNLKAEEDRVKLEKNTNPKKKRVSKRNKSESKNKVETNEHVISGESETAIKRESMETQKERDDRNQGEEEK